MDYKFTHMDENKRGQMVNVSAKDVTKRKAIARGAIRMSSETAKAIQDLKIKKGDVLAIAQVAAIQGVKQTSALIPMAHPLMISGVHVDFYFEENVLFCEVEVTCEGKTGVEMEALTGVSTGLLTVYDMCKALDKSMEIEHIVLVKKTGGKSGTYERREDV